MSLRGVEFIRTALQPGQTKGGGHQQDQGDKWPGKGVDRSRHIVDHAADQAKPGQHDRRYDGGGAGGLVRFAKLSDSVGYVHLRAFRHPTATADAIDEAIAAFGNARAIILDVRNNGGGSDRVGQIVASRFGRERSLYMTVTTRLPGGGFGPPVEWWREPAAGAYPGRVIVLTNSRTVSAAENLVLAMRTVPGAMIVGDTTAGAMADTGPMAIGDGWTFTVPVNVIRDPEGRSWEGVGLAPDLWARNTPADVKAGRDAVLELAIALANWSGQ